ncbi:hypothetical protein CEXT_117701 [Caerostris extrusa]|uniref:Uncharacterized protein n=1 Tax=Caerostris extrusa TaxID=172846 RepID=A0AAV4QX33_CAEEX|nr:hypothetical protein CEXT_117701 [Caerostris extrusa]
MHKGEQELSIKIWAPTSSIMLSQQGSQHPDWSILRLPCVGSCTEAAFNKKPSSRILPFQLCWTSMAIGSPPADQGAERVLPRTPWTHCT